MLISQVFFRGVFNDAAVGTAGFIVMVLVAWGLSKYTKDASDMKRKKKGVKTINQRKITRRSKSSEFAETNNDNHKDHNE